MLKEKHYKLELDILLQTNLEQSDSYIQIKQIPKQLHIYIHIAKTINVDQ